MKSSGQIGHPGGRWVQFLGSWLPRLVIAAAVWCLFALVLTPWAPRVARWGSLPFELLNIPVAGNVFTAAMLFVVGAALAVRKRAALWFVIVVFQVGWLVVAILVTLIEAWDLSFIPDVVLDTRVEQVIFVSEVLVGVAMIVVLWCIRAEYPARLAPGSVRRALAALAVGIGAAAAFGVVLTELFPNTLSGQRHRVLWPVRTAFGLSPPPNSPSYQGTGHPWVGAVIGALSTIALVWALAVLLRSARAARQLGADDELALRALLREYGEQDSLGYFATRRDKVVMFGPNRRAAVSYRVEAGTSLASGDPIGDPGSWSAAIEAWSVEARRYGWALAALSASERGAAEYRRAGFRVVEIGDEAIVDVADFRLTGGDMAPVRQAVSRARRAGYRVVVRRHAEVPADEMAHLSTLAEQWRGEEPERGFSMSLGRLGDPTDDRCVMVTALDAAGRVRLLLSFVPWGRRGLSLDLMRRDPDANNGVVEFAVVGLIDAAKDLGVRRLSLNFAMFRGVFSGSERLGAGPVVRATASMLTFASHWWQLETLYRSNVKYRPRWEPRFICFGPGSGLNRGVAAAGIAEGFLPGGGTVLQPRRTDRFVEDAAALESSPETTASSRPPRDQGHRRRKLDVLKEAGMEPYPVAVAHSTTVTALRCAHVGLAPGCHAGAHVSIVGRVVTMRDHGGIRFATLREQSVDVQVIIARDVIDAEAMALWSAAVDCGDQVAVEGEVVASRSGELSILVDTWSMAAKCLRLLPNAWQLDGIRIADRNVELVVAPSATAALRARASAIGSLRRTLAELDYLEVETPMLQSTHGGANARPFVTRMNAYGMDLSLRIAPELFLKRLAVGGLDRIFELNRNFRNEGVDNTHNPEFTSLEVYAAFADYHSMRDLCRELILAAATAVNGAPVARRRDGEELRLDVEWPIIAVHDAVSAATGAAVQPGTSAVALRTVSNDHAVPAPPDASPGQIVQMLYEKLVEPATTTPTFYTDFPLDVSPLARAHRCRPDLAERWDLVVAGMEIGTAYSELTDPDDQRARLTVQSLAAAAGDVEAMQIDEDFLGALELGLVPTGGLGLGVDRLMMLLTGANIRETLAFPFTRSGTDAQRATCF